MSELVRAGSILAVIAASIGCGGDDDQGPADATAAVPDGAAGEPDAGAPPATVFEHLVAAGTWIEDMRARPDDCAGCRRVARWTLARNDECSCVELTLGIYYDVPPGDVEGVLAGDQQCATTVELTEIAAPELDPLLRSIARATITQSSCGAPTTTLFAVFDGLERAGDGTPAVISYFLTPALDSFAQWPGWPVALDQPSALPLVRCAEADHAPDRDYCLPSCDFPGADQGRTECGFPDYEPPFEPCNELTQLGELIQPEQVAEAMPAPEGGEIADGTYVATAITLYTGPGGATGPIGEGQAFTSVNSGGVAEVVGTTETGPDINETFSYETNGALITIVRTCRPGGLLGFDGFSETAGGFVIYDSAASSSITYTAMP